MMEALRDLVVVADDEIGLLHRVAHTLGNAGVNIEGLSALTGRGKAVIHVLVADQQRRALLALAAAGLEVRACRRTVVCNVADRPDALAEVLEPLRRAGVSIEHAYLAVGGRMHCRVVVVVDDMAKADACFDGHDRAGS